MTVDSIVMFVKKLQVIYISRPYRNNTAVYTLEYDTADRKDTIFVAYESVNLVSLRISKHIQPVLCET